MNNFLVTNAPLFEEVLGKDTWYIVTVSIQWDRTPGITHAIISCLGLSDITS